MDPYTQIVIAGLTLVTEGLKLRAAFWDSLTPETRQRLAEGQAAGELRWLALGEKVAAFFDKIGKPPSA